LCHERRLDKKTEVLLLLTNHRQLNHKLFTHKKEIEKTYYAEIKGRVTEQDVEAFENGLILDDGYKTKSANLTILKRGDVSEIEVTITEGKFHQVKRMFEAEIGRASCREKQQIMGVTRA